MMRCLPGRPPPARWSRCSAGSCRTWQLRCLCTAAQPGCAALSMWLAVVVGAGQQGLHELPAGLQATQRPADLRTSGSMPMHSPYVTSAPGTAVNLSLGVVKL